MEDNIFDKVQEVDLKKTMENSYIDYAMSVIASSGTKCSKILLPKEPEDFPLVFLREIVRYVFHSTRYPNS